MSTFSITSLLEISEVVNQPWHVGSPFQEQLWTSVYDTYLSWHQVLQQEPLFRKQKTIRQWKNEEKSA